MKQLLTGIFICMSLMTFGQENKDLQDKIDDINSKYNELIGTDNSSNRSTGTKSEIKYAAYLEKSMNELMQAVNIMRDYISTHNIPSYAKVNKLEAPMVNVATDAHTIRDELSNSLGGKTYFGYDAAGLKSGTINFKNERDISIRLWSEFIKLKAQYYEMEDDIRSGRAAQRENQQRKEDSTKKSLLEIENYPLEKEKYSLFEGSIKPSADETAYICNSGSTYYYIPESAEWKLIQKDNANNYAFILNKDKTHISYYVANNNNVGSFYITAKKYDSDKNLWEFAVYDALGVVYGVKIDLQNNAVYLQDNTSDPIKLYGYKITKIK